MKIEILVLGQLGTNCYLVWDEETMEVIIIDPADEGTFIIQRLLDLNLKPRLIIATHGHFDHILAATHLKLTLEIPFLMHEKDLFLLQRTQATAKHFLHFQTDPPPTIDKYLKEGDEVAFGQEKLKVLETPGHSPGSISLYSPGILFSGDTLFASAIGRTDFTYGSYESLLSSIKEKLLKLPNETKVYPGHGRQTTIGAEKRNFI